MITILAFLTNCSLDCQKNLLKETRQTWIYIQQSKIQELQNYGWNAKLIKCKETGKKQYTLTGSHTQDCNEMNGMNPKDAVNMRNIESTGIEEITVQFKKWPVELALGRICLVPMKVWEMV